MRGAAPAREDRAEALSEADIVISLERPARGAVVVTRLCDYALRLYASQAYLAALPIR